jgi:hypothetical protein
MASDFNLPRVRVRARYTETYCLGEHGDAAPVWESAGHQDFTTSRDRAHSDSDADAGADAGQIPSSEF